MNLLELKDRHRSDIVCKNFTKWQEGINGADWEWWLTNAARSNWLGFRVQAKVLNLVQDAFTHLHYKKGLAYQTTRLKNGARTDGLVPLYCFYLHRSELKIPRAAHCGTYPYAIEAYGCALSSVANVETLRRSGRNDLDGVLAGATPWHCLVCCSGYGGTDLPSRAWAFTQAKFGRGEAADTPPSDMPTPGPRRQPPEHVLAALEGEEPNNLPSGVRGVLIIRGENGD